MKKLSMLFILFFVFSVFLIGQANKPNLKNSQTKGTQVKNVQTTETDNKSDDLIKGVLIAGAIFTLIGLFYGLTDKAVFYYDSEDLFLSFSPFLTAIIAGIAYAFTDNKEWILYVGGVISVLLLISVFYKSFLYNRTFLPSFSIAIAKLVLSLIILFKIFELFNPPGDNALEKGANRAGAAIFLAIITPIIIRLINGERVAAKRSLKTAS